MGNINELITGLVISGPVPFQVVPKILCIDLYINVYGLYLRTVGREDPAPSMMQPIVDTLASTAYRMYLPIAQ